VLLVEDIKKEEAAKLFASIGTFFLGSALPDHRLKVSGKVPEVTEYTQGFKQVQALRAQPERYEELFFNDLALDLEAAVLFLKYP
jgi:hypothetical protein